MDAVYDTMLVTPIIRVLIIVCKDSRQSSFNYTTHKLKTFV